MRQHPPANDPGHHTAASLAAASHGGSAYDVAYEDAKQPWRGVTKSRLLLVEDDDRIRSSLRLALGDEGYTVDAVADAELGFQHFSDEPPDLVLVDVMLPGMSGLDLCHKIRQTSAVPIIVVTARDDSHDIVAGLEAGADDYITKPFVFKELAARIRALLRRTQGLLPGEDGGALEFGELSINVGEGTVQLTGRRLDLTRTEFLLLCALVENQRRILSRDQLLSNVWGYDYYGDPRIVDAHIRRLRKKLEADPANPNYVITVRGLGYKFDPQKPG